jgi:hypothetical protein
MPRTCECEHPQSQHKLSKGGCRALDCYCAKFVSDFKPGPDPEPQPVDEAARAEQIEGTGHLPVIEIQAAEAVAAVLDRVSGGEATSAALRRVEQERDDLAAKLRTSELVRAGLATDARSIAARMETVKDELLAANDHLRRIAEAAGVEDAGTGAIDIVGGIKLLRAELTSARTELANVKDAATRKQWVISRKGGRCCERCEQEIRRGEAYEVQDGTGGLILHVHCPSPAPAREAQPAPAEPPLWQYTVWFCQPATGCGQRYSQDQPEHECGPLTAAVVTITRQPEGAPAA